MVKPATVRVELVALFNTSVQ